MTDPQSRFSERFLRAWQLYERTAGQGRMQAKAFAEALGVAPSWITTWSAADAPPPAHRVRRIAQVTGTDPGWLMFGPECQAPMRKAWPAESSAEPARETPHTPPVSQMRGIPAAEFVAAHKAAQKGRKQAGKKRGA